MGPMVPHDPPDPDIPNPLAPPLSYEKRGKGPNTVRGLDDLVDLGGGDVEDESADVLAVGDPRALADRADRRAHRVVQVGEAGHVPRRGGVGRGELCPALR